MNMNISGDTSVNSGKRVVVMKGKEIPFHPKMKGHSISSVNGTIYVDGFELVKGEWKRTLKALWYKLF